MISAWGVDHENITKFSWNAVGSALKRAPKRAPAAVPSLFKPPPTGIPSRAAGSVSSAATKPKAVAAPRLRAKMTPGGALARGTVNGSSAELGLSQGPQGWRVSSYTPDPVRTAGASRFAPGATQRTVDVANSGQYWPSPHEAMGHAMQTRTPSPRGVGFDAQPSGWAGFKPRGTAPSGKPWNTW